jgi:arylsulfatase
MPGAIWNRAEDPPCGIIKPLGAPRDSSVKIIWGPGEFLPTNHGFDEFFGNLYHLNAEEAPEQGKTIPIPPSSNDSDPGVIHSYADGRVEDTGALTIKRMETVDEEFLAAALKFMDKAAGDHKPFFVWFNSTRMHYKTHVKKESLGRSGQGYYNDGMLEHDDHVGALLKKLDDLGIAENTIVYYSTDNGSHYNMWPDGAIAPFRGEKNTNWEGGYRVPALVRWPGKIKAA